MKVVHVVNTLQTMCNTPQLRDGGLVRGAND